MDATAAATGFSKPQVTARVGWPPQDDEILIELKSQGNNWDYIAEKFPNRSATACRLRYQNFLEQRDIWDEELKTKLAMTYNR